MEPQKNPPAGIQVDVMVLTLYTPFWQLGSQCLASMGAIKASYRPSIQKCKIMVALLYEPMSAYSF